MLDALLSNLNSSISIKQKMGEDKELQGQILGAAEAILKALREDGKLLLCGNGGSAADAQHLAAEFTGRYYKDRPPMFAEALSVNSSYTTAVSNDYEFDEIYARLLRAMGKSGDVLLALSTSGNSKNVVRAAETAKSLGMTVIGMTGADGGVLKDLCDCTIQIPSRDTPRIQECHMLVGHSICEWIEASIYPS